MASGPIGVVLLNLGGPESEGEIALFLRRLLSDPKVVPLPWPLRPLLARLVAWRRGKRVAARYRAIGGRSPVGDQTRSQVDGVKDELGDGFLVRYAFRHLKPTSGQVVDELTGLGVRRLVALPLYPQWSQATSGSAVEDLERAARHRRVEVREAPSFPEGGGFIEALASRTLPLLEDGAHVVISAHGLPEAMVRKGDPYLAQVQRTAWALLARLPSGTSHTLAFQSRTGPARWTRPYLDQEILRLGNAGVRSVVVVPISFVCENLETLYELDLETAEWARACGIISYRRVPAADGHPAFIRELAGLARRTAQEAGWEVTHAG